MNMSIHPVVEAAVKTPTICPSWMSRIWIFVGIEKETGIDDGALPELYEHYFRCPLYNDDKWENYHAIGGRRLCHLTRFRNHECLIQKDINLCPIKGRFQTYGRVITFDRNGDTKFALYEKIGEILTWQLYGGYSWGSFVKNLCYNDQHRSLCKKVRQFLSPTSVTEINFQNEAKRYYPPRHVLLSIKWSKKKNRIIL